jgi:ComF family protein
MVRQFTNALLAALIAPPCAICTRVLDEPLDGAVCGDCWKAVAPRDTPVFSVSRAVPQGYALGLYEGTLREIIHALKYERRRSVAPRLANLMATHGRGVLAGVDAVVPVPLHRRRHRERGFNQADDLACGLGLPVLRALRRVKHTEPQVDLLAAARHSNVRDAFAIRRGAGRASRAGFPFNATTGAKVVVLVDDVTTTGATLDACARVLLAAGAHEVRALTAARVVTAPR